MLFVGQQPAVEGFQVSDGHQIGHRQVVCGGAQNGDVVGYELGVGGEPAHGLVAGELGEGHLLGGGGDALDQRTRDRLGAQEQS